MSRFFDRRLLTYARRERLDLVLTVTFGALSGVLIVLAARVLAGVVNGVFLGGLALADVWPLLVGAGGHRRRPRPAALGRRRDGQPGRRRA